MSDDKSALEHNRWVYEQERMAAERCHDQNNTFANETNQAAINNGNIALRTLVLINGGAAVAVLAFLGRVLGSGPNAFPGDVELLSFPVIWFAWGVAVAAFGIGVAYLSNYSITSSILFKEFTYEHPYVKETQRSRHWSRLALVFQIGAMLSAVASLGCFLGGVYAVRSVAVLSMPL